MTQLKAQVWRDDNGRWLSAPLQAGGALVVPALSEAACAGSCPENEARLPGRVGPERELATPVVDQALLPETHRVVIDGRASWALLCAAASPVRLNGQPLFLGLAALAEEDEIAIGRGAEQVRLYFSARLPAVVAPAPRGLRVPCPRCRGLIEPGSPATSCPACGAWHHQQDAGLACWSYAPHCAVCHQLARYMGGPPFQSRRRRP